MRNFFGSIFINRDKLREAWIEYPIKVEYYKITNEISKITICLLTACCSILILYARNVAILLILAYLWYLVIKQTKLYKKKMELLSSIFIDMWVFSCDNMVV